MKLSAKRGGEQKGNYKDIQFCCATEKKKKKKRAASPNMDATGELADKKSQALLPNVRLRIPIKVTGGIRNSTRSGLVTSEAHCNRV